MEFTNDNIFKVRYNTEVDRLQVRKKNKLVKKILKHKGLSIMLIILIVFSCLNFFLIYNFFKVLEQI